LKADKINELTKFHNNLECKYKCELNTCYFKKTETLITKKMTTNYHLGISCLRCWLFFNSASLRLEQKQWYAEPDDTSWSAYLIKSVESGHGMTIEALRITLRSAM